MRISIFIDLASQQVSIETESDLGETTREEFAVDTTTADGPDADEQARDQVDYEQHPYRPRQGCAGPRGLGWEVRLEDGPRIGGEEDDGRHDQGRAGAALPSLQLLIGHSE